MNLRIIFILPVICGILIFLIAQFGFSDTLEDDAYISFRYARNWIDGKGLVFNESEYVEGYTNLLWTVILGLLYSIGIPFEAAASIVGAIFGAILIVILPFSSKWLERNKSWQSTTWASVILGVNIAFQAEAAMGLETIFFTFLVFCAFHFYFMELDRYSFPLSGMFLGLAIWTRPEGLWIALYFLVFSFMQDIYSNRTFRRSITIMAITASFAFLLFAFRYCYYGELLPNTFYAKTGGTVHQWLRGWGYLTHFWEAYGYISVFLPILICAFLFPQKNRIFFIIGFILTYFCYVVYIGGDYKPSHRFLIPVLPFLCLIWVWSIDELMHQLVKKRFSFKMESLFRFFSVGLGITIYIILSNSRYQDVILFMEASHQKTHLDRIASSWLNQNVTPNASIATDVIGRIPFYTGLKTFDFSGLTDKHIAHIYTKDLGRGPAGHEKTDAAYIIGKKPSYILLTSIQYTDYAHPDLRGRQVSFIESEIWKTIAFHEHYSLKSIDVTPIMHTIKADSFETPSGRLFFNFFVRKDSQKPVIPEDIRYPSVNRSE
ncbi:hypothetical protein JW979_07505 [bacterium]|nr:hypothetical protein [candidate division CSSED10-310 bacterium]